MPLHASWVDKIFARLTVRYGTAFMRQYGDLDPPIVKADWARVLSQMPGEAIRHALENLPEVGPVTAMQFRAICNRAPAPDAPRLPAPYSPMPEAVRAALDDAATDWIKLKRLVSPAEYTIRRIEAIVAERGGVMSSAQAAMIASCRTVTGTGAQTPEASAVDRQRTAALQEASADAVAAYAAAQGIDLSKAQPHPRETEARSLPMSGAWSPGFGPREDESLHQEVEA